MTEQAKTKAQKKGERIRATLDGLATGLFPNRPFQQAVQTGLKRLKERTQRQPLREQNQNPSGIPSPPMVKERFMNRPLFQFFQPQEQQEPQLSPEEQTILEEHRRQMLEDAEKRKRVEEAKREAEERRKTIERARQKMAVENL